MYHEEPKKNTIKCVSIRVSKLPAGTELAMLMHVWARPRLRWLTAHMPYSLFGYTFIKLILDRIIFVRIDLVKINFKVK